MSIGSQSKAEVEPGAGSVRASGGHLARHQDEAPVVRCHCGPSTRIVTFADGEPLNFHVVEISDAEPHYHRKTTELYYILEGEGVLAIDREEIPVSPGSTIVIRPGAVHALRSTGSKPVRTAVVGVPALDPADEYMVERGEGGRRDGGASKP